MPVGVSWHDFLPYVAGTIIAIIGVWGIRKEVSRAHSAARLISLGPLFLAVPIAVYAGVIRP